MSLTMNLGQVSLSAVVHCNLMVSKIVTLLSFIMLKQREPDILDFNLTSGHCSLLRVLIKILPF
jgi:hypothetical protein